MNRKAVRGLFVTGTDTGVGKTYVAALVAKSLVAAGRRVGVYKPVASGCRRQGGTLVSDDALALWEAAGRPDSLEQVCPQRFEAPLAPHRAAQAEGRQVDPDLLRSGLDYWLDRSEIVVVEGLGGLMSPITEDQYVADLACDFGFPLIVVARNTLGTINQTLSALIVAATFRDGLNVAGVVLNQAADEVPDASTATNLEELRARCVPAVLAELGWLADSLDEPIDFFELASQGNPTSW